MKVFADLHHGGLFHSIQLMGRRVGFDVFRPVGMEWFYEGYFGLAEPYGNAIETVEQYLKIDNLSPVINDAPAFNNYKDSKPIGMQDQPYGVYEFNDYAHHTTNWGVTLEAFKNLKFDVIIASIPQHLQKFWKLREQYQPQAKLVFQIGNPYWGLPPVNFYPNILDSCKLPISEVYHSLTYHQEFETDVFFPSENPPNSPRISSFILFPNRSELFWQMNDLLDNDYEFHMYGHGPKCNHAPLTGIKEIALKMHESKFGWHDKDIDGYGHILHNWAAVGKPLIVSENAYRGRLAEELFNDPYSTINIDTHSLDEIVEWIRLQEDEKLYKERCLNMQQRFKHVVNFEKEGEELKKFFAELR